MASLSRDRTYVIVERGDTLLSIATTYGNGLTYTQLASLNGIPSPYTLTIDQKIKLGTAGSSSTPSGSFKESTMAIFWTFGIQSDTDNVLFSGWSWYKDHVDHYKVEWDYTTENKYQHRYAVWFIGSHTTTTDKQATYTIPDNATRVRLRVKPVSKTYTSNNKETSYWTSGWTEYYYYNCDNNPPATPDAPDVEIKDYTLIAELSELDVNTNTIQFQTVRDDKTIYNTAIATINESTNYVSYSCSVQAGHEFKVRCRSFKGGVYSEWSPYSENVRTAPAIPRAIKTCKASSETSVYLEWHAAKGAETYDVEYANKREHFDKTDQTQIVSSIETTYRDISGLEPGLEYFFRVRAVNESGTSDWSGIKSVVLGTKPAAPTTWSSTTTVIAGEGLVFYWVHNSEDGSSQTYAELELNIDGVRTVKTIKNSTDEDEKDKTSSYVFDTSTYKEGSQIVWRVRTSGITKEYGDWSIQRTVDIYAKPTLELAVTNEDGYSIEMLSTFPFYVSALAGPSTQTPIGYHLIVTSNEIYETEDDIGNFKMVNKGEEVYTRYFDISEPLNVELLPNVISLENGISYTVTCTVTMDSGLTSEASVAFSVSWEAKSVQPNAETSFDTESLVAYIHPYCLGYNTTYYKVEYDGYSYIKTTEIIDPTEGYQVEYPAYNPVYTTTGEQVFESVPEEDGSSIYYCTVEESGLAENVTLSIYRREFNGTFTELGTGIDNNKNTFITDPHPALDYARYRIVAIENSTGEVSYYDVPGIPIGETSIVIQWADEWSRFDINNEDEIQQPAWSGSMLKLPYNIDISDNNAPDVSMIEYIGRTHPVSYYGTQLGSTSSWSTEIPKNDKETLYTLRRLSTWMGDVYVREPSGSGYWANIKVSFSQKHCELTIPVSLEITRVEGGA